MNKENMNMANNSANGLQGVTAEISAGGGYSMKQI